jgi:hypothetical protein
VKRAHAPAGQRARAVLILSAFIAVILTALSPFAAFSPPSPEPESTASVITRAASDHVDPPLSPRLTAATTLAAIGPSLRRLSSAVLSDLHLLDCAGAASRVAVPRQSAAGTSCTAVLHAIATGRLSSSATALPPPVIHS